jgi:hypothetical protein
MMVYSFKSKRLPEPEDVAELDEGVRQGVHFTLPTDQLEPILSTLEMWFRDRDDVILVDHGTTCKHKLAYIILEWDEYEIDPLFLAILASADVVDDFTISIHDMKG